MYMPRVLCILNLVDAVLYVAEIENAPQLHQIILVQL